MRSIYWSLALSVLSVAVSGKAVSEEIPCGLTLRDTKEKFTVFSEGSVATDIVEYDDGSISWVATAAGGAGGGLSFYIKPNHEEINIANYESMDLELDYSPVEGKWNTAAKDPGFCIRILPWDSTGLFGGFEDLECFDTEQYSGTLNYNIKIPTDFASRVIKSSDFDSVLGFAVKFNDYQRGNSNGDQLQVTLKNVKLNSKADASEDKPFDDGLTEEQRGKVIEIYYPTRDYTVQESDLTEEDYYEKHAWVYLPSGYDESDKDTKYPVFVLLHGQNQNENTWGLSNKGRGGKIKGYMDRGMAKGNVEKFILVVVTEIASKNWGPNGPGNDLDGSNAFGGEFRNDLLPYIRKTFNVKEGRDNVAMAGLSMGGRQTYFIGMGELLDLISNYGVFSGALFRQKTGDFNIQFVTVEDFIANVDNVKEFEGLKIHNLYLTCGDADAAVYANYPHYVEAMKSWNRVENFSDYTYPGGTHDFPVWYHGFNDFIQMVFKNQTPETPETPKTMKKCTIKTIKKCRVKTM